MKYSGMMALFAVLGVLSQPSVADEQKLQHLLSTYCIDCHSGEAPERDLHLDTLGADFASDASFSQWVKIHDRLDQGTMPPKDSPQPEAQERRQVVDWLQARLTAVDAARQESEGRSAVRRLNRTEYENTLRDLFGIPCLAIKELLPEDGRAFGFSKSAAGLDLSYVQLAKYLEASDVALTAAIAPHALPPAHLKAHIPAAGCQTMFAQTFIGHTVMLRDFKYDDSLIPIPRERTNKDELAQRLRRENLKNAYTGSIGVLIPEGVGDFKPRIPFKVVYPGRYKIRMSVWSFLWDRGEVKPHSRTESALLSAEGRTLGYFDAPSLAPTVTEIEVWLNPMTGPRSEILFNAASLWPAGPINSNTANYVGPGIAVDWFEIEGPFLDEWPTAGHRRLFGNLPLTPLPPAPKTRGPRSPGSEPAGGDVHNPKRPPDNAFVIAGNGKDFIENVENLPQKFEYAAVTSQSPREDAERLLSEFLPRAFRRPVSSEDVGRYVDLFSARLELGDHFEVAMRTTYQAVLCSPDFLFLREPSGTLDDWAIASRLSYFFWNSMPDQELFSLAEQGRLSHSDVLREQVERMLADPKAERFIVDFTDQWLDLTEIDATTPDRKLYPEFRLILRDAMAAETPAFLRELLDHDLSTANLIDSNFAMLNQRLADHYGIPGVVGSALRAVPLPPDSIRGGLLTQASILKVTANGTVTSPVKRGTWVVSKILGAPPDPPPSNVSAIEPDVRGTTTIREMLDAHRADASCAACHSTIDPPGFALESFDVIGGWRTRYRSLNEEGDAVDPSETYSGRRVGYTWGPPVDSAGETADGRSFTGIEGFKQVLLDDRRAIARNMLSQLTTYATGAPLSFADRAACEVVLDQSAASDFGLRSLIHALVQSPLFLTK